MLKVMPQLSCTDVALRAFDKWTTRGQPAGTHLQDWQEAEVDLRQLQLITQQLGDLQQRLADTLVEQAQARRQLAAEHGVSKVLAVSSTLDDAACGILQGICEGLGWEIGVMWMVDRHANVLRCCEIWHSLTCRPTDFLQATRELAFTAGSGLPGRVWASQSPTSIRDMSLEDGMPRAGAAALENLRGAIAFPIRNGVEFLGVLEFFSHRVCEADEHVSEMMISIGSQISQFIERRAAEAIVLRDSVERRIAGRIQQALLPTQAPVLAGFQIDGRCVGACDVCGDCFDFIPLQVDMEECLGILIADASGHGMGAALRTVETRAYLRALALTCSDAGYLLTLANKRLAHTLSDEGFVTALLLRLEPSGRRLTYAGAGHCPGFVMDKLGKVRNVLTSTGCPLGIDPIITFGPGLELPITLQPGDLALMYTDGVVEAATVAGELFGTEQLLRVVRDCRHEPPDDIIDEVFRAVSGFCGKHDMDDDLAVIVIKAVAD